MSTPIAIGDMHISISLFGKCIYILAFIYVQLYRCENVLHVTLRKIFELKMSGAWNWMLVSRVTTARIDTCHNVWIGKLESVNSEQLLLSRSRDFCIVQRRNAKTFQECKHDFNTYSFHKFKQLCCHQREVKLRINVLLSLRKTHRLIGISTRTCEHRAAAKYVLRVAAVKRMKDKDGFNLIWMCVGIASRSCLEHISPATSIFNQKWLNTKYAHCVDIWTGTFHTASQISVWEWHVLVQVRINTMPWCIREIDWISCYAHCSVFCGLARYGALQSTRLEALPIGSNFHWTFVAFVIWLQLLSDVKAV